MRIDAGGLGLSTNLDTEFLEFVQNAKAARVGHLQRRDCFCRQDFDPPSSLRETRTPRKEELWLSVDSGRIARCRGAK